MSNDKPTVKQPQRYWRALAGANSNFEWDAIPDCPWEFFVQMIAAREQAHPEAAVPTIEYRGRVFNEVAWKSEKVLNIQPAAWIPEYAWLYSIALIDGTFEAAPRLVWMAAYVGRPDWDVAKVGKLLDELERIGLLERRQAEDGKVWGRWVGSEKFLPKEDYVKAHRYKTGKADLFKSDGAALAQRRNSASAALAERCLGVGLGVGQCVGEGEGKGSGLGFAAKSSENEQSQEQPQPQSQERKATPSLSIPTDRLEATAKATPAPAPAVPARETIGEHFRGDLTIASLSDHNLDDDVTWSAEDREQLNECIREAVSARAAQPYVDLRTNASLMGDAMKLLLETYEKNVPAPWLPVMQLLRDADSKPRKAKPKPPVKQEPSDWHRANGYEQCSDNIWRPAVGRESDGYTVKREDGIWWKS